VEVKLSGRLQVTNHDNPGFGAVLYVILLTGSLLLIAIGVYFSLDHTGAAAAYGVAVSGGVENSWISSAALRDLAYGCLTLTFTLLRDRRAVGLCLLFGTIIPLGDAIVVVRHSPSPWQFLPLHLGGAIVCLVLAMVLLRPGRS
jgi:Domain of unknown function (DUF4267)